VSERAILLDAVEAGPNDPMCCPTQLVRKTYQAREGGLRLASSDVTGTLSIDVLSGSVWTLVSMDRKPLPAGAVPPTITFDRLAVSGLGGCNRYRGNVKETAPGQIAFGPMVSTRMACDQPRMEVEDRFLSALGKATAYGFLTGRLVLSGPDGAGLREIVFEAKSGG
jgi:heat shock protein HslJ